MIFLAKKEQSQSSLEGGVLWKPPPIVDAEASLATFGSRGDLANRGEASGGASLFLGRKLRRVAGAARRVLAQLWAERQLRPFLDQEPLQPLFRH